MVLEFIMSYHTIQLEIFNGSINFENPEIYFLNISDAFSYLNCVFISIGSLQSTLFDFQYHYVFSYSHFKITGNVGGCHIDIICLF